MAEGGARMDSKMEAIRVDRMGKWCAWMELECQEGEGKSGQGGGVSWITRRIIIDSSNV